EASSAGSSRELFCAPTRLVMGVADSTGRAASRSDRNRQIAVAANRIRGIFSGLSRNTALMTTGSLFSDISTEMLTPILPIFLTQALHANGSIVGLVDGIAQALRNLIDGLS